MENITTEVVSRETIRPSSPTPSHLKIYYLSLLDQLGPLIYVPITLFYHINETTFDVQTAVKQLKESLSQTLSIFYPLAGRMKDHHSIDCNDEGVLFSVTTVGLHLQEYLKNPDLDLLPHFIPSPEMSPFQVAVQINIFSSGGLALGLRFLHRVADANTIDAFLTVCAGIAAIPAQAVRKDQASGYQIARGGTDREKIKPRVMEGLVHFPLLQEPLGEDMMLLDMKWMKKTEKSVRSRVVFDAAAISALKERAAEEDRLLNPTRFEVVTSLIWKHATAAYISMCGSGAQQQPSMMIVAVNFRPRTTPPMDENALGNNIWIALAHQRNVGESEFGSLGGALRGAVKKLATDLVGKEDDPSSAIKRQIKETKEQYREVTPDVYTCSSWCRFPFYKVDFGWGKPVWVAFTWRVITAPFFINGMMLIDDKSGDGVEAWLVLGENHTAKLFSDAEFLKFASLNRSIY